MVLSIGSSPNQPNTPPTERPAGVSAAGIDRGVPIPYYYQLEKLILADIASGRYQPGAAILSERQLCETYGVSRTTVRQAIGRLVADGVLYHRKGKGTFVVPPDGGSAR